MLSLLLPLLAATPGSAQVIAKGKNGPTNPDKPEFLPVGAQVNQTSMSRLISVNSIDDFCLWGPPEPGPDATIGNREAEVVAYCTKPRNNARLIPDGAIKSALFIRTPAYVQVSGLWDGTKANIPLGTDGGGELDPHGATGEGNPVGGNVTTNVSGKDEFYEEWMSFISVEQFCVRICTAEPNNIPAALMCEHELDIMGCNFVMAIPNDAGTQGFVECDGEAAAPPGLYPQKDGTFSTFRQRFTGTWGGAVHTIGNTVTPSAPAFFPKTSNCKTYSTIANGVDTKDYMVKAAPTLQAGGNGGNGTDAKATTVSVGTTSVSPTPVTQTSETPSASSGSAGAKTGSMTAIDNPAKTADANNAVNKPDATKQTEPQKTTDSAADAVRQLSVAGTFAALAAAVMVLV